MSRTPSTMLPLGTAAPAFSLPSTDGEMVGINSYTGAPLLVMFICNHCPYVKLVAPQLARVGREYGDRLGIVAINSNDADEYPEDGPEMMKKEREMRGYTFPYLFDETQEVARAYHAACTPDIFLFDSAHRLVYRGQFDSARPGNGVPSTGDDLRRALDALLAGRPIGAHQAPSLGCNIKWRAGNAPARSG